MTASPASEELQLVGGAEDYSAFGLGSNPFAFAEVVQPGRDPVEAMLGAMVAIQCERVWRDLVVVDAPDPVVWLAPAEGETMRADILFIAAMMRRLSTDPAAGVLPVYINTQLVYSGFGQGVANSLGDRLAPREFRRCLFALARRAFDEVVDGGRAAPELEGLDASFYRDMLAEGRLRDFSKALFPPMPPAVDAETLQKQLDEMTPEEAAALLSERQAKEEAWNAAKAVRRKLKPFLDRVVDEAGLGPAVTAAAHEGLRAGFAATQPFMISGDPGDPHNENLQGMVKLACACYRRVLFLLDQADCIVEYTEPERAALVGGLAEISAVGGRQVQWVVRGPRAIHGLLGLEERGFVRYEETAVLVPESVRDAGTTTEADVEAAASRLLALYDTAPDRLFGLGVIAKAAGDGSDVLGAMKQLGLAVKCAAARGASRVEEADLPVDAQVEKA